MYAFAPNGRPIIGTADLIPGNALIADGSFTRSWPGDVRDTKPEISFEYGGETDICWNGQYTKEESGETLYVADDGKEWRESEIVLSDDDAFPGTFDPAAAPQTSEEATARAKFAIETAKAALVACHTLLADAAETLNNAGYHPDKVNGAIDASVAAVAALTTVPA